MSGITLAKEKTLRLNHVNALTGSLAFGFLAGESKEFLYHPPSGGQKASELDWKIDNALIIKGELSYDFSPRFSVGIRGWSTLAPGNGTMDDYDWTYANRPEWSHWSHHERTDLNYGNEIDLNVIGWMIKTPDYKVGLTVGYQKTAFSWSAFGGEFDYDDRHGGREKFTLPDSIKIIGYQQRYSMPYIGFIGSWRKQDIEFGGMVKFSNLVRAKNKDNHYDRDITLRAKGRNSLHFSATLNAGYYILPQTKLYAEAVYARYEEAKSAMTWQERDYTEYYDGDWNGMDNRHYTLSLGIQHIF
ncbi:omptin family outer membrane protease [Pectobacterium cacticida]|uniref:omptin family outer membrane protease n=1 Tax=Pectobacterium cacticida TaxID=69221 RepID=UPI002FF1ADEC